MWWLSICPAIVQLSAASVLNFLVLGTNSTPHNTHSSYKHNYPLSRGRAFEYFNLFSSTLILSDKSSTQGLTSWIYSSVDWFTVYPLNMQSHYYALYNGNSQFSAATATIGNRCSRINVLVYWCTLAYDN